METARSRPVPVRYSLDPLDIVASTADAAFGTDEEGRIVIWNKAAERLLGFSAARVLGKPCHEILCGCDVFGNRFCDSDCSLNHMVRRKEAVRHFEMKIRKESGETLSASFSLLVVPGAREGKYTLIHLFQPVDRRAEADELIRRILAESPSPALPVSPGSRPLPIPPPAILTAREIEILRLLSDGTSTRDIADSLFISVATARNHIQNILKKMEVHSKLEAVALALRNHLL
jgi:PAS domain S-box-containing protein